MNGNDRSRPAANETASKMSGDDTLSIPAQLRRRRDAANRCEPLEDGHRDPLDRGTGRTFKPAFVYTDDGRNVAIVRGYGVAEVLRREGLRPMWSGASRGFLIDLPRLPDAVAILEWAGYNVRTRERGAR